MNKKIENIVFYKFNSGSEDKVKACVFYDGDYCLGGAIIDQVFMNDEERHY